MIQSQINNSIDWAITNLKGKVTDEFGGYTGECVSLVRREFIHRTGENTCPNSPNGYGDGYLQLPGSFKNYFTVQTFDRNRSYPRGSYAINAPTHHIMIYLAKVGDNASVFEQNADPDGSPAGIKTRDGAKITHILVPIINEEVKLDDDMKVTNHVLEYIYKNELTPPPTLGNSLIQAQRWPDDDGYKTYVGQDFETVLASVRDSGEYKSVQEKWATYYQSMGNISKGVDDAKAVGK